VSRHGPHPNDSVLTVATHPDGALMRAWVAEDFGAVHEALTLQTVPRPRPAEGQVLIRIAAAGVNLPDAILLGGTYQVRPERPFTPGREVVGVVVESTDPTRIAAGQRVVARPLIRSGSYAEFTVARVVDCFPVDDEIPDVHAAVLLVTYLTAHVALHRRARLAQGETVVVLGGSGGVGSAAIQLAKAAGARVIASARGADRAQACRAIGADVVVDRDVDDLGSAIDEATGRCGADVVVDTVGGTLFDQARRHLAWEGRAVLVGYASGESPKVQGASLLLRNQSVLGLHLGPYQDHLPDVTAAAFTDLRRLYAAGQLSPLIARVYPLEQAVDALSALVAGKVIGKVVLRVDN